MSDLPQPLNSPLEPTEIARLIALGRGEEPVDLLVKDCRLVNVLSGEVHQADMAVASGRVIGFGDYEAREVIDAAGRYLCPGLIDGHIHIESTLLSPAHLARVLAAHGTSAVICDPHEIANVMGVGGIDYVLEATRDLPLAFYLMMPSCVPATHMETSGATITARDIARYLTAHPERILGLAEMMNFPGVLFKDPDVLQKLAAATGRPIDGHCPLLSGKDLCAYILAGPKSDHEATNADEAREKLRLGMHLFLRQGTAEHNLLDLLPVINEFNSARASFVSDDRHPADLAANGHMDLSLRLAIKAGLDPVHAVQMASLNTARHYGLRDRGALAPGFRADFILLDDLERFIISEAYLAGKNVRELDFPTTTKAPGNTMHVAELGPKSFEIPAPDGKSELWAIGVAPGQILTSKEKVKASLEDGNAVADPSRDLAKLAVVERHQGSGRIGLGFVRGLGLEKGALASTVAHDSHNLILAGVSDADMLLAAHEAIRLGGGFVAVADNKVLAALPLPVAGLMSNAPLDDVLQGFEKLEKSWKELGVPKELGNPLMLLSFLALPVIPSLKLTDKGLVDVDAFDVIELWV